MKRKVSRNVKGVITLPNGKDIKFSVQGVSKAQTERIIKNRLPKSATVTLK